MNTDEIRQALARGYCSKENETKVLDPELIEAMALEVEKVISTLLTSEAQKREEAVKIGRERILEEVLQEIDDAETEHNPARHGSEPHEIFSRVRNYVGSVVLKYYGRYDTLTTPPTPNTLPTNPSE